MPHHLTTCTFCGAGCGIYMETANNRVVGVYPSLSHPTNRGRICVRGWYSHEVASAPDRLRTPLVRKDGRLREASWAEAMDYIAERLLEIRERHGPDAIAFLCSPRCSNEEAYLMQKLARAVIGTNNVDHGAGVYSHNSIDVLLDMLGVPASTNSIGELNQSEFILVDGVDLARQMPTIAGAVIRARVQGAKLAVIDTRCHRLAENADLFLQVRPGTESLLYGAMAKVILDRGLANLPFIKSHCREFDAFCARTQDCDLLSAAAECGIEAELIEEVALRYARARSAAILYSTGIEAREIETAGALVNLALLAGQLGKAGAGIFALTEHNNLQGVCDMGVIPERLPGYRSVADPGARASMARFFGTEPPPNPGLRGEALLADGGGGRVRAIWLCRYDPVSTAAFGDALGVLRACDLVVAQHLFVTESAQWAHVVLPTAAFGEERVTFTSTDRRIQLAEQIVEPPPKVTPAWRQLAEAARALGAAWNYRTSAEVMEEIGEAVPFYGGASYDNLARGYGRQWPCTRDLPLGTPFLFGDGAPPRRFRFAPIGRRPSPGRGSDAAPFTLVFGHSLYYWHRNVLIRHSETLRREYSILLLDYPEGFVEVNNEDARRLGVRDGEKIRIRSSERSATVAARVTSEMRPGAIFVPYFVSHVRRQICGREHQRAPQLRVSVEKAAQ